MTNIREVFKSYQPILDEFGEKAVKEKADALYSSMSDFISSYYPDNQGGSYLFINERNLYHTVLDCVTDICRLSNFHKIKPNSIKMRSYEMYWLLRRKPIQICRDLDDSIQGEDQENLVYANEKFATSYFFNTIFFRTGHDVDIIKKEDPKYDSIRGYVSTLYYYFKFRAYNPQTIEIVLHSFYAGMALMGFDFSAEGSYLSNNENALEISNQSKESQTVKADTDEGE